MTVPADQPSNPSRSGGTEPTFGQGLLVGLLLLAAIVLGLLALDGRDRSPVDASPPPTGGAAIDSTDTDAVSGRDESLVADPVGGTGNRPADPLVPAADDPESLAAALDRRCEGWHLTFYDGFAGDEVDPARWNVYDYPGHAGNGLRRPDAVSVADGLLTITAGMDGDTIVSGGLSSRLDQTYGRFEVRVRTEPDPNQVFSGVVLTWPQDDAWPEHGENNIYETGPGASRKPFSSFVHYPDGTRLGAAVQITHDADGSQWQELVMEWDPDRITFFRNGEAVDSITDADIIPDYPHHLTVQLDAMRTAPVTGQVRLEVDWVRVYRRASGPPPDDACASEQATTP